MEPLPDLGSLYDEELKKLIDELEAAEREVSYERRILHGKIDILRAELVARLQQSGGKSVLEQVDLAKLSDILAGKVSRRRATPAGATARGGRAPPSSRGRAAVSHVYCTECGFQNPEAANYCSRCGALLEKGDASVEATQTFAPEEVADAQHELVEGLEGPALVVRFGGGRAGESFVPSGERTRIGRSPECEIFLDDVTVSRNHAVLVERDGRSWSRTRARSTARSSTAGASTASQLANGDELQIGKYRLTFIER